MAPMVHGPGEIHENVGEVHAQKEIKTEEEDKKPSIDEPIPLVSNEESEEEIMPDEWEHVFGYLNKLQMSGVGPFSPLLLLLELVLLAFPYAVIFVCFVGLGRVLTTSQKLLTR